MSRAISVDNTHWQQYPKGFHNKRALAFSQPYNFGSAFIYLSRASAIQQQVGGFFSLVSRGSDFFIATYDYGGSQLIRSETEYILGLVNMSLSIPRDDYLMIKDEDT